jgi:glycosyltransferase involved in cell wall biosynthesis
MDLRDITPLVLSFNEEANLERTLHALDWATRIVLVDSFSSDKTLQIAARHRQVVVVQRAFDDHVSQWNFGLAQINSPWVLTLDADYVLSRTFVEGLKGRCDTNSLNGGTGYFAHFRYCVNGRPLRGSLYPPRLVLFEPTRARYAGDGHTQLLDFGGPTEFLSGEILHDDRKSLTAWLKAQDRYTTLEVEKLSATPPAKLKRVDRIRLLRWLAPLLMPFYCLLAKGLLLDGSAGLFYTFQRTYAELLLSLRLMQQDGERILARNQQSTPPSP